MGGITTPRQSRGFFEEKQPAHVGAKHQTVGVCTACAATATHATNSSICLTTQILGSCHGIWCVMRIMYYKVVLSGEPVS